MSVLLYDGTCGFCAASVQLILRHDRKRTLRFAALQGQYGAGVRERHPEVGLGSMVWVDEATLVEPERVFVRSAASLRVARYLGGIWRLTFVYGLLPRRLRDGAYDVIARHRHHLPGAANSCLVPSPEVRARFLD